MRFSRQQSSASASATWATYLLGALSSTLMLSQVVSASPQAAPVNLEPTFEKSWTYADLFECSRPGVLALTFDDGPDNTNTVKALDILKSHNIKGTFFVLGKMVEQHPLVLKRVWDEGHQIGTHTYSHPDLAKLPERTRSDTQLGIWEELIRTNEAIYGVLGVNPTWMRPPFGSLDKRAYDFITQQMGYLVANWNIDTKDWTGSDPRQGFIKFLNKTYERGFVSLQHDINKDSVNRLEDIIKMAKEQGFTFDTMAGCIGKSAPPMYLEGNAVQLSANGTSGANHNHYPAAVSRLFAVLGTMVSLLVVVGNIGL